MPGQIFRSGTFSFIVKKILILRDSSHGFSEQQAKVQVEAMQDVVKSYDEATRKELATKGDIQDVRSELQEVRAELKAEIADAKHEILKWMVTAMLAQTAILIGLMAFLK